jgi:hypothetical protein
MLIVRFCKLKLNESSTTKATDDDNDFASSDTNQHLGCYFWFVDLIAHVSISR